MKSRDRRIAIPVATLTFVLILVTSLLWGDGILFSHRKHLDTGLYCPACHSNVETSAASTDNNIPALDMCGSCHDPIPVVALRVSLEREVIFSHSGHLQDAAACTLCHSLAGEDADARMQLPSMATCISCHQSREQTEECSGCHTKLGSPELLPKSHTRIWIQTHGDDARLDEDYCANCHDQAFCQDCHQGDDIVPRPHRRNWIHTHSVGARKGIWDCGDCHEVVSDFECVSCHQSPQGRPVSHRRGGWLRRHEDEAEMNIAACATCHLNMGSDPLCLLCHEE